MQLNPAARTLRPTSLSLVTLEALPCGCVAGVYCATPTIVELELVEVKGPHCLYRGHQAGNVMRLGVPGELDGD
jgi:hypothetical protein